MRRILILSSTVWLLILSAQPATCLDPPGIVVKPKAVPLKSTSKKGPDTRRSSRLSPRALIAFDQSGGIAAGHKTFETTLKVLPRKDAEKLEQLIHASGLLNIKEIRKTNPSAADVFIYQFKIVDGKEKHAATYDDTTLPESFRPLLDFLRMKAVDVGRT